MLTLKKTAGVGVTIGTATDSVPALLDANPSAHACTGLYRGMKLWEAVVREAATVDQDKVIAALGHAKIAQGPGAPAKMVPA
ncbi:hypothetical protein [Paraburkholderia sp. DGU8]|jgi:hypothetical protein|uniref:hypothetical protein n=1 Tax=Paraburkholderia sp. DGU8 TaxID=3161997 RepID=UPI003465FE7F